ncbi:MAG: hypothetical protein P8J45_08660 [Phycisphaerales bacterium]|nr:hypothetical protein [Phycisphaerales bacterium]
MQKRPREGQASNDRSIDIDLTDDLDCLFRLGQGLTHQATDLELDRATRRNLHPFECFRILGHARSAFLDLEDTEIPELKSIASTEFVNDLIEERLHRAFDIRPTLLGGIRDPVNQVFFSGSGHACPFAIGSMNKAKEASDSKEGLALQVFTVVKN